MAIDAPADAARRLAAEFGAIGAGLQDSADVDDVLTALAGVALRMVPHAAYAGTSRRQSRGFVTVGASAEIPLRVDRIQYELESGPCVDAILDERMFTSGDLRTDLRWPEFGRRTAEETGILSMLAFRLFFEDQASTDLRAGLNLYSPEPHAFDAADETVTLLIATHGAFAIAAAQQRRRAESLAEALQTNRDIGTAIGIVMARLLVTRDEAFDLIRITSQRSNRKLRDVATDVIETGALDLPVLPSG